MCVSDGITGIPDAGKHVLCPLSLALLAVPLALRPLQMPDRDSRCGGNRGRKSGCEDEAGRKGAHGIHDRARAGDVAAQRAERLCQRALDNVDAVGEAALFGDAAAAQPVHADGMNLVDVGHRVVFFSEVGDRCDRRDVAVHRIDGFENDQLRLLAARRLQQAFQMRDIVVAEYLLLGPGAPHALDHRGVVELIGKNEAVRQQPRDGGDRRLVRDEAGGEDERRLLAMQIGEFEFEFHQRMIGAGDVSCAAGAGTHPAG